MSKRRGRSDAESRAGRARGGRAVTGFQQRVYGALQGVPRGRVTTYGDLACVIGCRSARAVGQALCRNPFAPRVPCHRVIASDLTIGGFQGESGGAAVRRKMRLLAGEGVLFAGGRLVDRGRLIGCGTDSPLRSSSVPASSSR